MNQCFVTINFMVECSDKCQIYACNNGCLW